MTHIDVWGKYNIASINGHQYFLLLIDDATWYTTVNFMKTKDEATAKVKHYLAYLKTHEKPPQVIHTDCGTEFLNENLCSWCQTEGIDLQSTTPYSLSQNGVAERMNRTLVELACTMLIAAKLTEFLWELAIAHTAYAQNCSYASKVGWMPYELWFEKRPDVSHLQEFGAPVWILAQGPHKERKMLPKSQRMAYVGFNDGSKSVIYYQVKTKKLLTSRNFQMLNATPKESTLEPVYIENNMPKRGAPDTNLKRKGEINKPAEPHKT